MRFGLFLGAAGLVCISAAAADAAAEVRSYHIGNSLTHMPVNGTGPGTDLPSIAASAGDTSTVGYQILCGESLEAIWLNPTTTCVAPNAFGYFNPALANNAWDAVTFEPYYDPQGTARTMINNMAGVLRSNPANAATKLYVYETWPQNLGAADYSDVWNAGYDPASHDIFHRGYFRDLTTQLRSDLGSAAYLIPAGEVLYRIDQLAKAGQVPGVSSVKDWYIDAAHLNGYGNLVATETIYATLFGKDPSATATPPGLSPALKAIIDHEVWDVVGGDALTGVVPEPSAVAALAGPVLATTAARRRRRPGSPA